ncbi:MAG: branched-chain amino acid transport system permease protein [Frankiales bacterium]|jgi:branched-chain amino acid transport system permease protein|nr:branched-chain amino acid transport system permease protein [Frankiales bacterium]
MGLLIQTLIFGLLVGGVYALMSSGLTLVFGVMGIVNMAQGAFLILAAYLSFSLWSRTGVDPILAAFIVAPVMGLIGWLLYKGVVERVQRVDQGLTVVATFSLAIIAEGVTALIWGPDPRAVTPSYFNQAFHVAGIVIPRAQLYAALLCAAVMVALGFLLSGTWLGRAITASSENEEGARLVGIEPGRVGAWIFALSVATTAFGGATLSFLYEFVPDSQDSWIGLTLSVVILGGLGSVPGAVLGGLLLGVAEALTTAYVSVRWTTSVPYVMILLVLFIRPRGIFSPALREDTGT